MKQLTIISGKGGTGKTSLAAALYYLALMAYDRHDYKTAMSKIKMSLALNPNSVDAQYIKAVLLGEEGKYNQGINLLEKVYLIKQGNEIEKEIALLYAKWAKTAVEQKEYKIALHRYRQAGTYTPEDPEIQINVAKTAFETRQYDIVTQALDRAQRIAVTEDHEEAVNELRKKLAKVNEKKGISVRH